MTYVTERLSRVAAVLDIATDRHFLEWQPMLGVLLIGTGTHAVSSFDLGYQELSARIPLAAIAVLPTFLLVALAHRLARARQSSRIGLVLTAYALGGLLRGAILGAGLTSLELGIDTPSRWRLPASIVIMLVTDAAVGYMWSTVRRAKEAISELSREEESLNQAIAQLGAHTPAEESDFAGELTDRVTAELRQILLMAGDDQPQKLARLVDDVVRPLSVDFARDIQKWVPKPVPEFRVSLRDVWLSIDPVKHQPGFTVGALGILLPGTASLLTFFDPKTALQLMLVTACTLALSLRIGYLLARGFPAGLRPPGREAMITLILTVMAAPIALGTALALRESPRPSAYVVPTFFAVLVFGWVVMVGNSALDLASRVTDAVARTRADLRWSAARINLLDWYHRGVVSRLLHGPVQNSIQVGMLRMRASDESEHFSIVSEVVNRINQAVEAVLDGPENARASLTVLQDLVSTWRGVAEIELTKSPQFVVAAVQDVAGATIVVDVAAEACSNAIRHGGAKRLLISCDAQPRLLRIEITDDGSEYELPDKPSGLGAKFLESCSVSAVRKRTTAGNVLSLDIPCGEPSTVTAAVGR